MLPDIDFSKLNKLAQKWSDDFSSRETKRKYYEDSWLESLRQFKGVHDPKITFEINGSRIYSHYTRSKVRPLIAKLNTALLPSKERNWQIQPTPNPRISPAQ